MARERRTGRETDTDTEAGGGVAARERKRCEGRLYKNIKHEQMRHRRTANAASANNDDN
jgi:hypothetical protein